ncbi:MAG TPA: PilZ domain-containing protein [Planctomycetota bacterium]|nr:PilZ domain-containing protein [Planctomycetota bacterium]
MKEDRRKSVRVHCQTGLAILRTGGSPPITCKLLNLSEGGCRVAIEARDAGIWHKINKPNQLLELLLSSPPHLDRFVVSADIRNVRPAENQGIELGVQFRTMEPKRCGVLRLALLKLATERLRTGSQIIQIDPLIAKIGASKSSASQPAVITGGLPPIPTPAPAPAATPTPSVAAAQLSKSAPVPAAELMAGPKSKRPRDMALGSASHNYWQDPFQGKRIGEVLVRMGKLTQKEVDELVEDARLSRERFGQYLLKNKKVTGSELCRALALAHGMPTTDLRDVRIRRTYREIFPIEIMKRYEFIPFDANEKVVCIATGSPFPEPVLKEIKSLTKKRVEVFLAEEDLVLQLIDKTPEDSAGEVSQLKNRRHPRFTFALPVTYFFCTSSGERLEEVTYNGQTVNLSEGGFRLECPHTDFGMLGNFQSYGMYVQLGLKFPPHEFSALCKPIYVYEKETVQIVQFPFEMGLAIMDMSASARQQLRDLLEVVKKLTPPKTI